jgi:hypothetical protein
MKPNEFSSSANSKTVIPQNAPAGPDSNQSKTAHATWPEAVTRRAYAIYEQQGSQPGHEEKIWLEAEAQLFGGIEHESQMHPGSSLFTTEH